MAKKSLVIILVLAVVVSSFMLVACKSKKGEPENYNVVENEDKINIVIIDEVITTQQEVDQKGTMQKYECTKAELANKTEGLISAFKELNIKYEYGSSFYVEMGQLKLSEEDKQNGYRLVVYTTVEKDQDTTDNAKSLKFGKYSLVQTNKVPTELSLEDGCVIIIAKTKLL